MTQEEKQLLLKDLCGRLPYGVKIIIRNDYTLTLEDMEFNAYHLTTASYDFEYRWLRPYLRPMSSMTEEEAKEVCRLENFENRIICVIPNNHTYHFTVGDAVTDWLNEHHFDFRGLIEKGLALEAPEGMYK